MAASGKLKFSKQKKQIALREFYGQIWRILTTNADKNTDKVLFQSKCAPFKKIVTL